MKTVAVIMGTRPEAIKLCPVVRELKRQEALRTEVVFTGQHGQLWERAATCFSVLPDERLSAPPVGVALHTMTAHLLAEIGQVLARIQPALLVVQGDTASAFAGALAGFYCGIPVAHVEAGLSTYHLRSPFPEELHRQAITLLSDLHFAPTAAAKQNLLRAGIPKKRVYLTGNTGIDALKYSLVCCQPADPIPVPDGKRLLLFTAHRRENWGGPIREMLCALRAILEAFPDTYAVCPMHPNPTVRAVAEEVLAGCDRAAVIDPPELTVFHHLLARAYLVLTDSGGIQEEATALGIPTLVMRHSTERTEGIRAGSLRLVGTDRAGILQVAQELMRHGSETYAAMRCPSGVFGDGNASARIVRILCRWLEIPYS